jgi:hypothetical protein
MKCLPKLVWANVWPQNQNTVLNSSVDWNKAFNIKKKQYLLKIKLKEQILNKWLKRWCQWSGSSINSVIVTWNVWFFWRKCFQLFVFPVFALSASAPNSAEKFYRRTFHFRAVHKLFSGLKKMKYLWKGCERKASRVKSDSLEILCGGEGKFTRVKVSEGSAPRICSVSTAGWQVRPARFVSTAIKKQSLHLKAFRFVPRKTRLKNQALKVQIQGDRCYEKKLPKELAFLLQILRAVLKSNSSWELCKFQTWST